MDKSIFTMPTIDRVKAHPRYDEKSMDAKKIARWLDNRFKKAVADQQRTGRWSYDQLHEGLKGCFFDHSMLVDLFADISLAWGCDESRTPVHFFSYGRDGQPWDCDK
jgi:hypothetical protein